MLYDYIASHLVAIFSKKIYILQPQNKIYYDTRTSNAAAMTIIIFKSIKNITYVVIRLRTSGPTL